VLPVNLNFLRKTWKNLMEIENIFIFKDFNANKEETPSSKGVV
jgi:hypothetical protein